MLLIEKEASGSKQYTLARWDWSTALLVGGYDDVRKTEINKIYRLQRT